MIGPKQEKQPKKIPAKNRAVVEERAGGRCEGCGLAGDLDLHHRKYRSRGGSHDAHNLIALCGLGNTSGCHGTAHSDGFSYGWAIPSWGRDEIWPSWRWGVGWVVFDDDGGWREITESTAELIMSSGGRP